MTATPLESPSTANLRARAVKRRSKALIIMDPDSLDLVYGPAERASLREQADFVAAPLSGDSIRDNLDMLAEVEVIFSGWGAPLMDEEFLEAAPNLGAVFYAAGSVRYFTPPAFWERNILLTAAGDANAIPVSEYCASAILLSLKHFWRLAAETRKGRGWVRAAQYHNFPGAFRSTVGFVSLGNIARKTLRLLDAFDLHRIVYSIDLTDELAREYRFKPGTLDEVFSEADVVSLHTPSLPETRHMITARHFEQMKPGATFINTARGEVVLEADMIRTLEKRPDITAILDVTDPEPPAPDSPLLHLPNVVLTPHIAGSAGPECQRLGHTMVQEFFRYLNGEPLRYRITAAQAALMA